MDMLRHLEKLFSYDAWANREVLSALENNQHSSERARKVFFHILSAERLWLQRLEEKPQTLPVWPELTFEQCEREIADLAADWSSRLAGHADLSRTVHYKNSRGEPWSSREDDIMLHVVTHSAYHRGQIAADMRAAGITPAYTDYIHGVRQGLVK